MTAPLPQRREDSVLPIPGVRAVGTILQLPADLPHEDWRRMGFWLGQMEQNARWWMGAWIEHGEHAYGHKYADAIELTGLSYNDLRDCAWVYRAVPVSVRSDKLKWSHHKQVAKLEDPQEQARFLALAAERRWSKERLGREVDNYLQSRSRSAIEAPREGERYALLHLDIAAAVTAIDAGSVDVIVTDPPYDEGSIELFDDLWRLAVHALKPGGLCAVMTGHTYVNEYVRRLDCLPLRYWWILSYRTPGASPRLRHRPYRPAWKPILCFLKDGGAYSGPEFVPSDELQSDAPEKDLHPWQQSESGMSALIRATALRGDLVLDPFAGSGTTGVAALRHGCSFLGIDSDADALRTAAARLSEASTLAEADQLVSEGNARWVDA